MPPTPPAAPDIAFRGCPPDEEPARSLIASMVAEMVDRYSLAGTRLGVPLELRELAPPSGVFLVGWAGGEAVAGGGLRTLGEGVGEIKRMYVAPAWRGRGVARRLLEALEGRARELGLSRVRLDTGTRQPDAQHLYRSAGYVEIPNYNGNDHAAFWGEKQL